MKKYTFWARQLPPEIPEGCAVRPLGEVDDAFMVAIGCHYECSFPEPHSARTLEALGFRGLHLPVNGEAQ